MCPDIFMKGTALNRLFISAVVWARFLLTCKNKSLVFHPEVKGLCHKCPSAFDGLIDIQRVPDSSLITQTSGKGPDKCKKQHTSTPCCS